MEGVGRPGLKVRLDWRAYFREFCAAHGGSPLEIGGRLLFGDGWAYAKDYAGPEWPPPEDAEDRRRLMRTYWLRRRAAVARELEGIAHVRASLEELQRVKSLPLQQTGFVWDDDAGKNVARSGPLDMDGMRAREDWLRADFALCEDVLAGRLPAPPTDIVLRGEEHAEAQSRQPSR